jgi:hypothetical protein
MPFHICWDEIQIFLLGVPFLGFGLAWLRSKLPARKPACPCEHEHEHDQEHV